MPTQRLLQLLTLSSANLPVGAYTYSQGLESAIELGQVHDEASSLECLQDYLALYVLGYELPWMQRLYDNLSHAPQYLAQCDNAESRLEARQMGHALRAWAAAVLDLTIADEVQAYLPVYVAICRQLNIPFSESAPAYAFSQLENLTLVLVKAIPLGQMAGQRVLWALQKTFIESWRPQGEALGTPTSNLPGLSHWQIQHEHQYSRLFRS